MDFANSFSDWTKSLSVFNFVLQNRPNVLQDNFEMKSHAISPQAYHLLYAIPLSFVVYFMRLFIEK